MSERRIIEFTCDRCSKVDRSPDGAASWQPPGWRGVSQFNPPLSSSEDFTKRVHLCRSCVADLDRFLAPLPMAAEERPS